MSSKYTAADIAAVIEEVGDSGLSSRHGLAIMVLDARAERDALKLEVERLKAQLSAGSMS